MATKKTLYDERGNKFQLTFTSQAAFKTWQEKNKAKYFKLKPKAV